MGESRRSITLRQSKILRNFRAGVPSSCATVNTGSSRAVEIAGLLGFDCMWIDAEHTAADWQEIEHMIMACKMTDMDSFVRISKGPYNNYIKPFELDATGIMVPHVTSGQEAAEVVRMTRFPPLGRRAIDTGNADGAYAMLPYDEYVYNSNHNKFIILQIEDYEAIEHLDAICSTEGIDGIFFGSNDFSNSLGLSGQLDHPKVQKARITTCETTKKYGKALFLSCPVEEVPSYIELGADIIACAADVIILAEGFSSILHQFKDMTRR
ncbi:MAG: aldolase/citrate lyase family protein [Sphaerochaetaceae bacterium]|nr:aldolase/citrate lyase family protein [Sphaerochaetaceae bacterium]NLO61543.1 aldolase [Spirochaetales bacterium]MDD3671662.1 aldolase/citrate lyase family protein [Sphaerochaetaceae bacterium]MDD4259684.1 aldolase/citrate lyase family protein [Sphaerochaetaceae bacterium]MDD4842031.1 aldolase/citrate lyase family protein [Sphaerochaetaceae bacterium]